MADSDDFNATVIYLDTILMTGGAERTQLRENLDADTIDRYAQVKRTRFGTMRSKHRRQSTSCLLLANSLRITQRLPLQATNHFGHPSSPRRILWACSFLRGIPECSHWILFCNR